MDGGEQLARDVRDRSVRGQRHARGAPVAVLGERLVSVQVEAGDERARAVGRRQRPRLPAARRQAQGGVLKLRLGRRERHRQLAEDLRMGVQRVAGVAPGGELERGPLGHGLTVLAARGE